MLAVAPTSPLSSFFIALCAFLLRFVLFFVGDSSPTPPRRFQRLFVCDFSLIAAFFYCIFLLRFALCLIFGARIGVADRATSVAVCRESGIGVAGAVLPQAIGGVPVHQLSMRSVMLCRLTPMVDALWHSAEVAGGRRPATPRAMRAPLNPMTK